MVCTGIFPHTLPIASCPFSGTCLRDIREVNSSISAPANDGQGAQDVPDLGLTASAGRGARGVLHHQTGIAAPKSWIGPEVRPASATPHRPLRWPIWAGWTSGTVGDNLLAVMDNRQSANPLLRLKSGRGQLGVKTGEGFFIIRRNSAENEKRFFRKSSSCFRHVKTISISAQRARSIKWKEAILCLKPNANPCRRNPLWRLCKKFNSQPI